MTLRGIHSVAVHSGQKGLVASLLRRIVLTGLGKQGIL